MFDYAALLADYGSYHRTAGNRRFHAVGIPLIAYALVAWSCIGSGLPIAALLLPVYFLWDPRVGAALTVFVAASAVLATRLPGWTGWAAFAAGCLCQYLGHVVCEKRRPAFTKDLAHLLIGPAWLVRELTGR